MDTAILRMEYKYQDITEKIIGSAMRVHGALGNDFQEVIYQRALEIEMKDIGLKFEREFEMPVYYKGNVIGQRRVDFFVEKKVMVELKSIIQLEKVHLAQAKNYLEAFNMEVGLLINFGNTACNSTDCATLNIKIRAFRFPQKKTMFEEMCIHFFLILKSYKSRFRWTSKESIQSGN